jgi:uncharacterized protein YegL
MSTAAGRGNVLPVYVLVDESSSMGKHIDALNSGLSRLHEALLGEPMAAAKVRISILGFADTVRLRVHLADLRREMRLPTLTAGGRTDYRRAFGELRRRIPADVRRLKAEGYRVHRPAVFVLTDGQPSDDSWRTEHAELVDRDVTPEAPNIIACGIGSARAETILDVATRPEFAFVALEDVDVGAAIAQFCTALTHSIIHSAPRSTRPPRLVVQQPAGFSMAIDVV